MKIFKTIKKKINKIKEKRDYKKENKELKEKLMEHERYILELEDLTDKDLNIQRVKDLRSALGHERDIKRKLRQEILDLRKGGKRHET